MSNKVELNAGSIIIILVIFAVSFLIVKAVYNVFRDTVRYTFLNGWKILSPSIIVTWGAPMAIPFLVYYYSAQNAITLDKWVLPLVSVICGIWILIMTIGTICKMGAKNGIAVVLFRLLLSTVCGVLGLYIGAIVLIGLVVAVLAGGMVMENGTVLYGSNGTLSLAKCGNGQYIDADGNVYNVSSDGSLCCTNGNIFYRTSDGSYICNGEIYYN